MQTVRCVLIVGALCLPRAVFAADPPASPWELAASLGYAVSLGDAERGGRVGDIVFGAVPVAFDAAYRIAPRVGIAAHFQYGIGIPTLCHAASDCVSSLGTDAIAGVAVRIYLPECGALTPTGDAGIGYEWLTTRLSDSGARSTRAYEGPVIFRTALALPFRLRAGWSFGPAASLFVATFARYALDTNVGTNSGDVTARTLHAWMSLDARLAHSF